MLVTGSGGLRRAMAKMPKAMEIVRGDECFKYLLLSNTHSGDGSVIVKFTTVRVVCQNTLMLAMDDGQKAYRVRHSKQMQFKLEELAEFLAITQEVFVKAEEQFKRLAKVQMTDDRLEHYFEAVFPRTDCAEDEKREKPERWEHLRRSSRLRKTSSCRECVGRCGGPTTPSRGTRTTSNRSRKSSRISGWSGHGLAAARTQNSRHWSRLRNWPPRGAEGQMNTTNRPGSTLLEAVRESLAQRGAVQSRRRGCARGGAVDGRR